MKLKLTLYLLVLTLAASCSFKKAVEKEEEDDIPDEIQGTIIGNPQIPKGMVQISSTMGVLRYVVTLYGTNTATIQEMSETGAKVISATQGSVRPIMDGETFLGDYEIFAALPRKKELKVMLKVSVEQTIVGLRFELNGVRESFLARFVNFDRTESYEIAEIEDPVGGSCGITPTLDDLKTVLCEKVHECRPSIAESDCLTGLERTSITDEFGLAEDENVIFASIRALLGWGLIEFNNDLYCSCRQRIVDVTCDSIGSYVATLDELWELEEVIPQECGNDEFPGIFLPDEFSIRTEEPEPAVDSLVDALCTTVSSCDSEISYSNCSEALEEGRAADIWDEFGLSGPFEGAPADVIRIGLNEGLILVDETELDHCINEHLLDGINDDCDFSSGSVTNMENYVDDDNCEAVFSERE